MVIHFPSPLFAVQVAAIMRVQPGPLFRAPRAYVHLQQGLSDDPLRWTGLHIPLFAVQGLESLRQLPGPIIYIVPFS